MATQHYIRGPLEGSSGIRHNTARYACSCGWESTWREDPEQARLESCRHLARVLRFGSVTIGGDHYLVPRA